MLWYEAGTGQEQSRNIGNNPGLPIRRIKLIANQLGLLSVYIASCIPSEIKNTIYTSELQQSAAGARWWLATHRARGLDKIP
jgi:hypothetical protein